MKLKSESGTMSFADVMDISVSWFSQACLFSSDKKPGLSEGGRVIVDHRITDKATIISQHILQLVSGVPTPLGIATAYHVYNQTRSKSLITLNNRLGMGISYERLQRQHTAQSEKVMQQAAIEGVYVPDTMSKKLHDSTCVCHGQSGLEEEHTGGREFQCNHCNH